MLQKTYVIHWLTIEGRHELDCFVPFNSPLLSTVDIRRCENPRKQAHDFCEQLRKHNLKVVNVISGYNRGIL